MTVVESFDEIGEAIREVVDKLRVDDFKGFFDDIVKPYVAAVHSEYFSSSSGPEGSWQPWAWRAKDAPESHNTLVVSQRLAFSLQPETKDNVMEIGQTTFEYGTSVVYAAIHNYGGSITAVPIPLISRDGQYRPAGNSLTIPARPFLGLKDIHTEAIVDQLVDWVVQPLGE